MKDMKNKLDTLNNLVSMVEDEKYKDVFTNIYDVLQGLYTKIDEILVNEAVLAENFKYMNEDISDIQEELFEEVSLEDLEEMEEEYKEITCNNCGKPLYIEETTLKGNKEIKCPYCNENIVE